MACQPSRASHRADQPRIDSQRRPRPLPGTSKDGASQWGGAGSLGRSPFADVEPVRRRRARSPTSSPFADVEPKWAPTTSLESRALIGDRCGSRAEIQDQRRGGARRCCRDSSHGLWAKRRHNTHRVKGFSRLEFDHDRGTEGAGHNRWPGCALGSPPAPPGGASGGPGPEAPAPPPREPPHRALRHELQPVARREDRALRGGGTLVPG
jgi:hypothetical protein